MLKKPIKLKKKLQSIKSHFRPVFPGIVQNHAGCVSTHRINRPVAICLGALKRHPTGKRQGHKKEGFSQVKDEV